MGRREHHQVRGDKRDGDGQVHHQQQGEDREPGARHEPVTLQGEERWVHPWDEEQGDFGEGKGD